MFGYKRKIEELPYTNLPEGHRLISKAEQFMSEETEESEESESDVETSEEDEPVARTGRTRRERRQQEYHELQEEHRLLSLIGCTGNIKTQILSSSHSDLIKAKCLQMMREYNDDHENNSSSLSALQTILKLPTHSVPMPISLETSSFDQTTAFLKTAWDHMESQVYGQQRAKSEIIEYLASNLLTPTPRVLGLVGPPGVGKTSLAIHGIADVIGVPFYQISIGGLRDVTYFSGSMRCWKGAHQGKFADILINKGCLNPVIYIDELDKVSDTSQDIYGLLTHVADSQTNRYIHDHYLGIDLDLSKATFIFSYNDASMIPAPLRDRIKEIYFDAFNTTEKVIIARDFIIPERLRSLGMENKIIFHDDIIEYANEHMEHMEQMECSGVRHLNKGYQSLIDKIIVNVMCNQDSYNAVAGKSVIAECKRRKVASCRGARFMPYYRPVSLPYYVTRLDIDFYLGQYGSS